MTRNRSVLLAATAAAAMAAAWLGLSLDNVSQAQDRRSAPEPQYTATGSEGCLTCHAGETMTVMAETPHGDTSNPHTPDSEYGCESCHGPGSVHVSRARGGAGFPALLNFDKEAHSAEVVNAPCTECHEKDMGELLGMEWTGSVHATEEVACVDCHTNTHSLETPLADRNLQNETCAGCHEEILETHPRFEDKGIVFDRLMCYDCHDVHQLIGAE